jgi:3'-phosphoadenosine 5'-phosphosulfate sulfotransferase (PAPS reductase)/FAD synthetase
MEEKVALARDSLVRQMREGRHCFIATSMGKDSSVLCAIAVLAIEKALAEGVRVPHVLFGTSETGYDNPVIDNYAKGELDKLGEYLRERNLPASVISAQPSLSNDYGINMMGGRSVASVSGMDRNCSIQLKVTTAKRMKKMAHAKLPGEIINVVGLRWDESISRGASMKASGARPDLPVEVNGEKMLSPIAHLTFDDLWTYIGMVRNADELGDAAMYQTYSNFEAMLQAYRDANGGECEMNAFAYGKANSTGCGARTGCHFCLQIQQDKSLENMLIEYPGLRPLVEVRDWLGAIHFDPAHRRWLTREPNADGELSIEPNAYSPDTCRQLLRFYLTAQAEEEIAAEREGRAPAFDVVDERQLIAVQLLWARHAYHEPWAALRDWKAVYEQGKRWYPPTMTAAAPRKDFPRPAKIPFPLPVFTGNDAHQLRSAAQMAAGACVDSPTDASMEVPLNDRGEFDIDLEGAQNLLGFLAHDLIARSDEKPTKPSDQVRTLLNLGTVSLRKANTGYWEKIMTIADALHEAQIPAIIDQPDVLKEKARQFKRYGAPIAGHLEGGVPLAKRDTPEEREGERWQSQAVMSGWSP